MLQTGAGRRDVAAITFDDGYLSVLKEAVPVLEEEDVPATFYVATRCLGGKLLWRDKVRLIMNHNIVDDFIEYASTKDGRFNTLNKTNFYAKTKTPDYLPSDVVDGCIDDFLSSKGMGKMEEVSRLYCRPEDFSNLRYKNLYLGNHSHSHYVMSSLDKDKQALEIDTANDILKQFDCPVSSVFSVPFGGPRSYNEDTLNLLQDMDFTGYALSSGFTVRHAVPGPVVQSPSTAELPGVFRFMPMPGHEFIIGQPVEWV